MKVLAGIIVRVLIVFLMTILCVFAGFSQENKGEQQDPNVGIFMSHLQKNRNDIHDVIMRFHNEDPGLKGIVIIHMKWENGLMESASIDSTDIENKAFADALVASLKKWKIPGLSDNWEISLPVRTVIYGSNDPKFSQCGIFTGKVQDISGNPVYKARLFLYPLDDLNAKPDTAYTNREGIFIRTLIPVGNWKLECTKDGYLPVRIDKLEFKEGLHVKRTIVLNE